MRTISALFQVGGNALVPGVQSEEPLEARVASISAEIAAAIAQAQSRVYEDDDEEDEEEDEESGSGQEIGGPETIGPNTSGIRGLSDVDRDDRAAEDEGGLLLADGDEDDDSDAFPIPLRTRKGKDPVSVIGTKRKR